MGCHLFHPWYNTLCFLSLFPSVLLRFINFTNIFKEQVSYFDNFIYCWCIVCLIIFTFTNRWISHQLVHCADNLKRISWITFVLFNATIHLSLSYWILFCLSLSLAQNMEKQCPLILYPKFQNYNFISLNLCIFKTR